PNPGSYTAIGNIRWFSEVYDRKLSPNYCYFRAIEVVTPPADAIFWKSGGLKIDHVGSRGCYFLCTSHDGDPGKQPRKGSIEIGYRPRAQLTAYVWAPSSGWDQYESIQIAPVIKPEKLAPGYRTSSKYGFADPEGNVYAVNFFSVVRDGARVSYGVENLSN